MFDQETPIPREADSPTVLDRAWASTRPRDLTDLEFDRIWADVQRAHDRRSTLRSAPASRRRRAIALVGIGLAQAAAVFVVASAIRPGNPGKPDATTTVRAVATKPAMGDLKIDVDEIVVIALDGATVDTIRTKADDRSTLAYLDVPPNNPNDQLNHWESLSDD